MTDTLRRRRQVLFDQDGAPDDLLSLLLLTQYDNRPAWSQVLRRAVMFRLAVSLAHPRTTPESLVEMLAAAEVIRPLLD